MAWVKLDDNWNQNPKIRPRSAIAVRLYLSAIAYCCKWGTDGLIDGETLRELLPRREYHEDYVRELVVANMLHDRAGCDHEGCPGSQGLPVAGTDSFVVHDFHDWQLSADEWEQMRAKNAAKQRRWRERQAAARAAAEVTSDVTPTVA